MGGRPDHGAAPLTHGWRVVATLSVTETVSWGILYYGFPVFWTLAAALVVVGVVVAVAAREERAPAAAPGA